MNPANAALKASKAGFPVPPDVESILAACPGFLVPKNAEELVRLACDDGGGFTEVAYDVPGRGRVVEAVVCRVKNGVSANYVEPYMRRRDPDCLLVGDDLPTDKPRFKDARGEDFAKLRAETFEWLKKQRLIAFPFVAGAPGKGSDAVVVAPANAGFFGLGLALLQGILDARSLPASFSPEAVIYVAPPFRHTHFGGKQMVVHRRTAGLYELFSYNLYPGPSAKKGVYGMLIHLGEKEQWVTAHCSTVQVQTPYGNKLTLMHEGASGGGKSEMLENAHRQRDGRLLLGHHTSTDEKKYLLLPLACDLKPVTDDMALCHPSLQKEGGKLSLMDAEDAWFVRVNHIKRYGTDPHLEEVTTHPPEPLLFLNIDAVPGSTALIWEHIEDKPGVRCPNPRVVLPRRVVPDVVQGEVTVDIRSFGVRTPPCTKEKPTYGIIGLFHVLPPALAWLWRLAAPRGHDNPSIITTEGMSSEGVGSYWPFATGRRVDQANLLLKQILSTPGVRHVLCPNQHIGAWRVGFMPQWIMREYLARRGNAWFASEQLRPARCPLLGYEVEDVTLEGQIIDPGFLQVHRQPEVGEEGYDAGAKVIVDYFDRELPRFLESDLDPVGRRIIERCLAGGTVEELARLGARA